MAVRIRLKRMGRRNRPAFRIVAIDSRSPRDGKEIEILGHYDPYVEGDEGTKIKEDRIRHWLSVGAKPSDTVASFLRKRDITIPWEAKKHTHSTDVSGGSKVKSKVEVKKPKPKASAKAAKEKAEEKAEELKNLSRAEKKQLKKG